MSKPIAFNMNWLSQTTTRQTFFELRAALKNNVSRSSEAEISRLETFWEITPGKWKNLGTFQLIFSDR